MTTEDKIKVAIGAIADISALLAAFVYTPVVNWLEKPKTGLFKAGNGRTVNDKSN